MWTPLPGPDRYGRAPRRHVAIWATNVPQWYITFWATTKIGAVLVTVNTAYKIHEAEYLLRQSDTHTLVMIDGFKDSDYVSIIKELCPELKTTERASLSTASGCRFCGISSRWIQRRRLLHLAGGHGPFWLR